MYFTQREHVQTAPKFASGNSPHESLSSETIRSTRSFSVERDFKEAPPIPDRERNYEDFDSEAFAFGTLTEEMLEELSE